MGWQATPKTPSQVIYSMGWDATPKTPSQVTYSMGWEATPKMPSQVIIYSMGWEAIHHTSNALTSHTYLPRTTPDTSLTNFTYTA